MNYSAIMCINDWHYYKLTSSYNREIAQERLNDYFKRNIKFIKSSKDIEKVYIFFMGDLIDGLSIYPAQTHYQDGSQIREQLMEASDIIVDEIVNLQKKIGLAVEIIAVKGNHGRSSRFNHDWDNYELILWDFIKIQLKDTKCINIRYTLNDINLVNIYDKQYLITHGDAIKCYCNTPYLGIEKYVKNRRSINEFKDIDYVFMGHFHQSTKLTVNSVDVYLNGSSVTDDDWALKYLGKKSDPVWFTMLVNSNGVDIVKSMNLLNKE